MALNSSQYLLTFKWTWKKKKEPEIEHFKVIFIPSSPSSISDFAKKASLSLSATFFHYFRSIDWYMMFPVLGVFLLVGLENSYLIFKKPLGPHFLWEDFLDKIFRPIFSRINLFSSTFRSTIYLSLTC